MLLNSENAHFFDNKEDFKCLLITPPLLEPTGFYPAMPILAGQLYANGFDAKNLDLNIKFFRTILSKEYIEKTKKIFQEKNIEYDEERINYLSENIDIAIKNYREIYDNNSIKQEAEKLLNEVICFVATPYENFNLYELKCVENVWNGYFINTWEQIKTLTSTKDNNIFYEFFEKQIEFIKEQNVDFIGITIPFPATRIPALTLAKLLKEKTDIHISLGGHLIEPYHLDAHPEILEEYCDSVCIGDGEESIVKLVDAIYSHKSIDEISGIITKNTKNYNQNQQITSMENIANPSFDGINFNEYMAAAPIVPIMISKGCYWGKCSFCSLGPKYKRYCIKTPQEVVSEIKYLYEKYKLTGYLCFQDDAIHPNYLNKLADEIFKQDAHFSYTIFGRFEKEFTRELLEKLYKSGLRSVYWGLESGSKKILQDMNKGIDLENVQRILKDCYELGISNMAGIIVNFPTETITEYNETIEFLKTIKNYVTISPGNFAVMRNSIIGQNLDKYGIKVLDDFEFSYGPTWEYYNISKEEQENKWQHFCDCVKKSQFDIDLNKEL